MSLSLLQRNALCDMVLPEESVPERSVQRIGAITRYELHENAFRDTERLWGGVLVALLSPSTNIEKLPIFIPDVLQHMVTDVHCMLMEASEAMKAAMAETVMAQQPSLASANQTMSDQLKMESGRMTKYPNTCQSALDVLNEGIRQHEEHERSLSLYEQYKADIGRMKTETQPLLDDITGIPAFDENDWYGGLYFQHLARNTFARHFLPVSQSQLRKWAEWVCVKKRWIEYVVLTHCCGRAFLRALNT